MCRRRIALVALAVLIAGAACTGPHGDAVAAESWVDSTGGGRRASSDTGPPLLPRQFMDTRLAATPSTGRRISVRAGDDLQRALDEAKPGDVLLLEAGAQFSGAFTLPKKEGSAWITVRSASPDTDLPPEGTRAKPQLAPRLARLVSPNDAPTITAAPGAHHYRLVALEISTAPTVTRNVAIVELGSGRRTQRSRDQIPHHIIIDRSYVHGHARLSTKRCIAVNSAYTAVIDSYVAECHDRGFDSQAIAGWNGPGPFKIVNNYLEGSGENVLFGGGDPGIRGLIPSDIEIRRNHIFKPLAWRDVWTVKNLLELKNAQRVLIEGNVFENNWAAAQAGFALVLKSENQDGTAPWSVTREVTIRLNKILNSAGGVDIMGTGDNVDETANHILIEHNVFDRIGDPALGELGRLWQLVEDPSDITFEHNTGFAPSAIMMLDVRQKPFVTIRNNLVARGKYGIVGSDRAEGLQSIAYFMPGSVITHNVIIGAPAEAYPSGNSFPPTPADVGFVDFPRGDYRLSPRSRYRLAASDGGDPGANIERVEQATRGVVLP